MPIREHLAAEGRTLRLSQRDNINAKAELAVRSVRLLPNLLFQQQDRLALQQEVRQEP